MTREICLWTGCSADFSLLQTPKEMTIDPTHGRHLVAVPGSTGTLAENSREDHIMATGTTNRRIRGI